MRRFWAVAAMVFVLGVAAANAGAQETARHPELGKFEQNGGKVDYLGHAYGLDGWMLTQKDGSMQAVYTTREGGLVMGMLINPEGVVETTAQLAALNARQEGSQAALPGSDAPSAPKAERLYAALEKARWIKFGEDKAPYIYMLVNVSCEHCQNFWNDLQEPIKAGKLQVRLLPFGTQVINREGGAALLSVADPAAAWRAYIKGDKSALGKDKITGKALDDVDANSIIVRDWKLQGTPPFTFYRKLTDGKIAAMTGRPGNTMLLMSDLIRR